MTILKSKIWWGISFGPDHINIKCLSFLSNQSRHPIQFINNPQIWQFKPSPPNIKKQRLIWRHFVWMWAGDMKRQMVRNLSPSVLAATKEITDSSCPLPRSSYYCVGVERERERNERKGIMLRRECGLLHLVLPWYDRLLIVYWQHHREIRPCVKKKRKGRFSIVLFPCT